MLTFNTILAFGYIGVYYACIYSMYGPFFKTHVRDQATMSLEINRTRRSSNITAISIPTGICLLRTMRKYNP